MRKASVRAFVLCLALAASLACAAPILRSQTTPSNAAPAQLKISGAVTTPLSLSAADLKAMPRKTLKVTNPHNKADEVYEGVALVELLRRAGVPQGENFRGAAMADYVVVQASDGYRAVYSLAELDPSVQDSEVIVADTMNGAPLGQNEGPLKLVAPHDKRPARWVRMVQSLTVFAAQNPTK